MLKTCLFADAEIGKDAAEQVVAIELAGDFTQVGLRLPQFFGGQLAGVLADAIRQEIGAVS